MGDGSGVVERLGAHLQRLWGCVWGISLLTDEGVFGALICGFGLN